ncbi:MAG: DUF6362 family protein [Magnetococcus sp. YQC-5]
MGKLDEVAKWTSKMVLERLEEAAVTLKRLRVAGVKPQGYGSTWPDIVYAPIEVSDWCDVEMRLGPPTPDAITRMDEALEWLRWLEPDHARMVWMHADKIPRKIIEEKYGTGNTARWREWKSAIFVIVSNLNRIGKVVREKKSREDVFRLEFLRTGNATDAYRRAFPCAGLSDASLWSRAHRLAKKAVKTQGSQGKSLRSLR